MRWIVETRGKGLNWDHGSWTVHPDEKDARECALKVGGEVWVELNTSGGPIRRKLADWTSYLERHPESNVGLDGVT